MSLREERAKQPHRVPINDYVFTTSLLCRPCAQAPSAPRNDIVFIKNILLFVFFEFLQIAYLFRAH